LRPRRPPQTLRVKHGCDRLFALALLLLLFPLGLLIALSIVLESAIAGEPPCIFVAEKRRSANRTFALLKFRVFRVSAWQHHLTHDSSVSLKALERRAEHLTWVGRRLKRCYLDELPQLLNILRGEMSLVGPRPYFEGDWLREPRLDIPARRSLKAGLVGPYQSVKGTISGLDKVNLLDTEYFASVASASAPRVMLLDLRIIARSVRTVLRAQGL
jgi:lipopolysaccharide/colanic/teichoic acid biosynthesis glycosyltransferase